MEENKLLDEMSKKIISVFFEGGVEVFVSHDCEGKIPVPPSLIKNPGTAMDWFFEQLLGDTDDYCKRIIDGEIQGFFDELMCWSLLEAINIHNNEVRSNDEQKKLEERIIKRYSDDHAENGKTIKGIKQNTNFLKYMHDKALECKLDEHVKHFISYCLFAGVGSTDDSNQYWEQINLAVLDKAHSDSCTRIIEAQTSHDSPKVEIHEYNEKLYFSDNPSILINPPIITVTGVVEEHYIDIPEVCDWAHLDYLIRCNADETSDPCTSDSRFLSSRRGIDRLFSLVLGKQSDIKRQDEETAVKWILYDLLWNRDLDNPEGKPALIYCLYHIIKYVDRSLFYKFFHETRGRRSPARSRLLGMLMFFLLWNQAENILKDSTRDSEKQELWGIFDEFYKPLRNGKWTDNETMASLLGMIMKSAKIKNSSPVSFDIEGKDKTFGTLLFYLSSKERRSRDELLHVIEFAGAKKEERWKLSTDKTNDLEKALAKKKELDEIQKELKQMDCGFVIDNYSRDITVRRELVCKCFCETDKEWDLKREDNYTYRFKEDFPLTNDNNLRNKYLYSSERNPDRHYSEHKAIDSILDGNHPDNLEKALKGAEVWAKEDMIEGSEKVLNQIRELEEEYSKYEKTKSKWPDEFSDKIRSLFSILYCCEPERDFLSEYYPQIAAYLTYLVLRMQGNIDDASAEKDG